MLEIMQAQDFDKVFSIMESSFPVDEYRPYGEQRALLNDSRYQIYVLKDLGDREIQAFISVWKLDGFAFVEHFAVSRRYRNQGLGAMILKEIHELLDCCICLEVELPDTNLGKRRIAFYQRNGFFLNDYPYMQPAISKGRTPLPLFVMTSISKVSADTFEHMKTIIYRDVYKVLSA